MRPRVTFAVMAYSQMSMVQEAINSAFAQDCEPMEILLSDDNSPDGTFDVMQSAVRAYDGPHDIVLNRNATNLGLIPHVNLLFEMAAGEIIVYNAGDDASLPERTTRLLDAQQLNKASLVHSNVIDIGPDNVEMPLRSRDRHHRLAAMSLSEVAKANNNGIGATFAWHKDLYRVFGPITETASIEDRVLYFRARLLKGVAYVEEPLVRYRRGIGLSFSTVSGPEGKKKGILRDIATFKQRLADCQTIDGSDALGIADGLRRKIDKRHRELDALANSSI